MSELTKMNVPFDVRKLEVGDFLWIARSKTSKSDELVLPYIVERKRMDDLGSSIKDHRFKEQKVMKAITKSAFKYEGKDL